MQHSSFFFSSSYSSPWEGILKLIRQDNFHQQLQCFDKDNVSDNVYHQLTTFVNNPNAQHHLVARWSIAAEQLCLWLHAIHSYCTIFRQLQPKKQKLKEFESKIAKVTRLGSRVLLLLENCYNNIFVSDMWDISAATMLVCL